MSWWRRDIVAWVIGASSLVVFGIWWLGWEPGFIDVEAVGDIVAAQDYDFTTTRPPLYNMVLWLFSLGGSSPGLLTSLQAVAMSGLLGLVALRLAGLGMPPVAAGVSVLLIALLPAVAVTILSVGPEALLAILLTWTFAELLRVAAGESANWALLRVAIALSLVMAFGVVGAVAGGLVAALIAIFEWPLGGRRWQMIIGATLAVGIAVSFLALPLILDVERAGGDAPEALIPLVAATVRHHPDSLSVEDVDYLTTIAPLDVWSDAYECFDSGLLMTDREFDESVVRADVGRFSDLALNEVARHPATALGQRWCAAANLAALRQSSGRVFSMPAYTVPANELGLERNTVSTGAFNASKAVLLRTQQQDRLWLWWLPGLPLTAGTMVLLALGAMRKWRLFRTGVALAAVVLAIGLAGASPDSARLFPVYLLGWLAVPLLWFVFSPPMEPPAADQGTSAS